MKLTYSLGLVVLLLGLAIGCESKSPPSSAPASGTTTADPNSPTDSAAGSAAGTTARSSALVDCAYEPPMSLGQPCGEPSGELVPGTCDPVAQTGCGEAQHCRFAVKLDDEGNPTSFFRVCSDFTCGSRTKLPGDACQATECMPGSLCVSGICKRYCRRSDAAGCAPDEFCVAAPLNPEFGYCESSCAE